MKEVEVSRHNLSKRRFYTYCKERAKEAGLNIEDYLAFEDWIEPIDPYVIHNPHSICKHKPCEAQFYLEGSYNFILEYDDFDNYGYCYIAEY